MADHLVPAARSRVVLVGVAEYDDPALPDLPSGGQAASDLARGFAKWSASGQVRVDTVVNSDREEFVRVLVDACAEAEDQLVVHFSGHGVMSSFGELVLATRDCDTRAPELTGMPWNSVRRALSGARARSVLVVLDCCFSGAVGSAWQENWQTAEATAGGPRGQQVTYLVAGRAPWPYQPGVLSSVLRAAMDAASAEEGAAPDFAAAARSARHKLIDVRQPRLAAADAPSTASSRAVSPVFITYKTDDRLVATALDHALIDRLGGAEVFNFARSIPPGTRYGDVIEDRLRQARLVVAVIGPRWESQLHGPDDWVVREIATAFARAIPVVPVLVGTRGPVRAEDVPEQIREVALLQFVQVGPDVSDVIDAVVGRLLELL